MKPRVLNINSRRWKLIGFVRTNFETNNKYGTAANFIRAIAHEHKKLIAERFILYRKRYEVVKLESKS